MSNSAYLTVRRYDGFVLLPILGIGPLSLPRFFGLASPHDFPEVLVPSGAWKKKAMLALGAGLLILISFFVESAGWVRTAYALRFDTTLVYLLLEFPFRLAPKINNALGLSLRIAFGALVSGFILVAAFPAWRVGLLHLTLIGGFAVITFTVATRVMFGHSGNLEKLKQKNWWLIMAVGLMLIAMATRISGDFWPKITPTHYSYGAILWIFGALLWAVLHDSEGAYHGSRVAGFTCFNRAGTRLESAIFVKFVGSLPFTRVLTNGAL